MNGGLLTISGTGHWMPPAVTPGGSVHLISVGMPGPPGFCQYVCQPGCMVRRMPAMTVSPGRAESADRSRSTLVVVAKAAAAIPTASHTAKIVFNSDRTVILMPKP